MEIASHCKDTVESVAAILANINLPGVAAKIKDALTGKKHLLQGQHSDVIRVNFHVDKQIPTGSVICITGNMPELGSWH